MAKSQEQVGGKSRAQKDELLRLFNDLPVVDAKMSLRFYANAADVSGAVRRGPENCVLARACRRLFSGKNVLFWRSVAYVECEHDGERRVERFKLSLSARRDIAILDATGIASPGGYVLDPVPTSMTLDNHLNYQRGYAAVNGRKKRNHRPPISIESAVRDGRGAVHFEMHNQKRTEKP